jgi:tetratricopeptide (TPR) repeat protein
VDLYNGRGSVFMKVHKFEEAIVDYTKAINLSPNVIEYYLHRGVAYPFVRLLQLTITKYENLGILEQALSDYNRMLDIDPNAALG